MPSLSAITTETAKRIWQSRQDGISNGINIRLGDGTGNFPNGTYIAAERGSPVINSADFNGDGNLDVAICNNNNELRVLSGNGAGGFGSGSGFRHHKHAVRIW